MKYSNAVILVLIIIIADQALKIFVKTHFCNGDDVRIMGDWFRLHFIENEGMAWGTEIPGAYGKLFLTLFRLVAVCGIGYWLWDSVERKHSSNYLVVAIALILAGAFGNIIDSVFYGVIFDDSSSQLATLFSDQPYGQYFHGKVVDMFYFPIWHGNLPVWLPIWGGKDFTFFNAIFNIADMSISTGVGILIVFNKKAFQHQN